MIADWMKVIIDIFHTAKGIFLPTTTPSHTKSELTVSLIFEKE
jgi:hypothetical protein